MLKGKNGKVIFNNEWQNFDEAEDCCWFKVSRFYKVKGGMLIPSFYFLEITIIGIRAQISQSMCDLPRAYNIVKDKLQKSRCSL
jgi:hypothetical protein